ncbi:hypothetical protein E2I00_002458, partial [Balaenoptera physalus]
VVLPTKCPTGNDPGASYGDHGAAERVLPDPEAQLRRQKRPVQGSAEATSMKGKTGYEALVLTTIISWELLLDLAEPPCLWIPAVGGQGSHFQHCSSDVLTTVITQATHAHGERVNTGLERHLQRPREDFMCSQMIHVPRYCWDLYPEEPSQIGCMCPTEPQGCSGRPKGWPHTGRAAHPLVPGTAYERAEQRALKREIFVLPMAGLGLGKAKVPEPEAALVVFADTGGGATWPQSRGENYASIICNFDPLHMFTMDVKERPAWAKYGTAFGKIPTNFPARTEEVIRRFRWDSIQRVSHDARLQQLFLVEVVGKEARLTGSRSKLFTGAASPGRPWQWQVNPKRSRQLGIHKPFPSSGKQNPKDIDMGKPHVTDIGEQGRCQLISGGPYASRKIWIPAVYLLTTTTRKPPNFRKIEKKLLIWKEVPELPFQFQFGNGFQFKNPLPNPQDHQWQGVHVSSGSHACMDVTAADIALPFPAQGHLKGNHPDVAETIQPKPVHGSLAPEDGKAFAWKSQMWKIPVAVMQKKYAAGKHLAVDELETTHTLTLSMPVGYEREGGPGPFVLLLGTGQSHCHRPTMFRTLVRALLVLVITVGPSQASGFTEKGLSLLSYQLCNYSVSQNFQSVEAVHTSHLTYVPCGWWVPWRRCPKTVSRTQYVVVEVPKWRNVTDCCEGYEQLGLYCVPRSCLHVCIVCPELRPTEHVERRSGYVRVRANGLDGGSAGQGEALPRPGALNRSEEFASRPGICPVVRPEASTSPCTLDADCPGLQKCCPSSGSPRCSAPAPRGASCGPSLSWACGSSLCPRAAPERKLASFWYNVTVLVKMDFTELQQVDPRLLDHMRLLHSMVTSALQPLDATVHHLHSAGGDTLITVSQLLLGLPQPEPVSRISAALDGVVKRVYEVIGIRVQDVDECSYDELNACPGRGRCLNMEGSYQCLGHPESPTSSPQKLDGTCEGSGVQLTGPGVKEEQRLTWEITGKATAPAAPFLPHQTQRCLNGNQDVGLQPRCELEAAAQASGLVLSPTVLLARRHCPPVRDLVILNVTSSSFQVSWSLHSTQNCTFQVQVYQGEEMLRKASTRGTSLEVAGLEAGVLYGVRTSYQACWDNVTTTVTVRTEARVFEVKVRILNRNVTEGLLDRGSPEFQNFSQQLLHEVATSFPPALSDLYRRGKLRMQVVSLRAGSVVVRLRLTVQDPEFPVGVSTLSPMLPPLWASTVFQVDQWETLVQGGSSSPCPGCAAPMPSKAQAAAGRSRGQVLHQELVHILVWRPRRRKGRLAALTARTPASRSEPKNCQASGFCTRQSRVVCILLRLTPEPRAGRAKRVSTGTSALLVALLSGRPGFSPGLNAPALSSHLEVSTGTSALLVALLSGRPGFSPGLNAPALSSHLEPPRWTPKSRGHGILTDQMERLHGFPRELLGDHEHGPCQTFLTTRGDSLCPLLRSPGGGGALDQSRPDAPSERGCVLAGDAVSPTGGAPSPVTGETAPGPSTETTALGLETPALSPSPGYPWGTTAAGQAWTPGLPPRRGVSGMLDSPGWLPLNSTTEPPFRPAPTQGPMDHVEWHASLPTRDTPPVPLDPTWPKNSDPGPSGSPDLPSANTPASLKTPVCGTLHPRVQLAAGGLDSPGMASPEDTHVPEVGGVWFSFLSPGNVGLILIRAFIFHFSAPMPIRRVIVSNVTSTGFHVAWVADLTLRPTFQLTLISARTPTVHLETRNASLTLSGLEPGVLHLVEIVAKACGKESDRARLKVRTAAQKLSGKVRIANVNYSESFRNASSKEYQAFLELFFRMEQFAGQFAQFALRLARNADKSDINPRLWQIPLRKSQRERETERERRPTLPMIKVRNSLPASMLQHLDTGGVQVEVTRISSGSVVVEFNLLVIADVDVREVSATFLAAFQNAPLLEVVGGDPFIAGRRRLDPNGGSLCRGEASSDAQASCEGFLSCFLNAADYDECDSGEDDCAPGSSCRNSLGSFTCSCEGGTPDLPVEYSGRPCEAFWVVPHLRVLLLMPLMRKYTHQLSDHNSTHVILVAAWGECGTVVQSNMTSTVVRTTLRNDLSPEGIIRHLKILSPIHCAFQNDLLTSSGYTPEWGVYTVIEDLHGAGSFVTEMQLFIGDSPIPQNYTVSASDDVKIEVGLYKQKSNLKVVLTECWATPSSNARDPVMFGFINNSCPIPNTHTNVIENGNSNKAQFKLKIFSFINNSIVYLHCKLRICMESPGTTCKINCDDFRSLRNGEPSATHQMSWGPLIRSEGEPPAAKPGLGAGYLVLILRMTGKYNFKTQSNNFSYQVFHE